MAGDFDKDMSRDMSRRLAGVDGATSFAGIGWLVNLLLLLGLLMCLSGAAIVMYFVWFLYQVLNTPQDVYFIQYLMQVMPPGALAIGLSGMVEGKAFTVNFTESVGKILFTVLIIFGVGAISGFARGLIGGGANILTAALKLRTMPCDTAKDLNGKLE